MPGPTPPEFLTLREAAALLRLSQRALYDLARRRALPSALLGGKWLFPRAALTRWAMREALSGVPGAVEDGPRPSPPPVVAGSQDPLLDWAVRQAGGDLALGGGGSLAGLEALAAGRAVAAAVHLPDPEGGPPNEAAAREVLGASAEGAVGLCWARREQGLITAPGNPLGLAGVADLARRPDLRVAGRQPRAGSHLLLVHLLSEAGVRLSEVATLPDPALDEDEVAAAVAEGRAEAGFGVRAAATTRGLGFVPLAWERFDLVARPRDAFRPPLRALMAVARTEAFRARAARLGGYDLSATGEVSFVV